MCISQGEEEYADKINKALKEASNAGSNDVALAKAMESLNAFAPQIPWAIYTTIRLEIFVLICNRIS